VDLSSLTSPLPSASFTRAGAVGVGGGTAGAGPVSGASSGDDESSLPATTSGLRAQLRSAVAEAAGLRTVWHETREALQRAKRLVLAKEDTHRKALKEKEQVHCYYTMVTLLLHHCYTIVTPLSHHCHRRATGRWPSRGGSTRRL
jgi:hypothetical protein